MDSKQDEQPGAIEKDVDIACARDFHALYFVECFQLRFELFGDCARRLFLSGGLLDEFCEFEGDGKARSPSSGRGGASAAELLHFDAKNLASPRSGFAL